MLLSLIIIWSLAVSLTLLSLILKGRRACLQGLMRGGKMLLPLLPLLIITFFVTGMLEVAIPRAVIREWLGTPAGWRGIVLGSILGILLPGGPYINFPIVGALFSAGASPGTVTAILSSWALLGIGTISFELAIAGLRFTIARLSLCFWVPIATGFIAQELSTWII